MRYACSCVLSAYVLLRETHLAHDSSLSAHKLSLSAKSHAEPKNLCAWSHFKLGSEKDSLLSTPKLSLSAMHCAKLKIPYVWNYFKLGLEHLIRKAQIPFCLELPCIGLSVLSVHLLAC